MISPQLNNVETNLGENLESEDNSVDNAEKGVTQKEKDTGKKEINLGETKSPVENSVPLDTSVLVHTHSTLAQKDKEKDVRETVLDKIKSGGVTVPENQRGGVLVNVDLTVDGKGDLIPPVPTLASNVEIIQKEKLEKT